MQDEILRLLKQQRVSRDDLQEACKKIPKDLDVCLYWTPRTGKTRAAISIFEGSSVLILSNTELIRDSWKKELIEYKEKWTSICYQSLKTQRDTAYDVIVCDEADLVTDNYLEQILEIKFKRIIFLTGTSTFRTNLLFSKLNKVTGNKSLKWEIDFNQAISWGILPKPRIVLLGLNLRNDPLKRDQLFSKGADKKKKNVIAKFGDRWKYLRDKTINLNIQCTEKEWYEMKNKEIEYFKEILNDFKKLKELEELEDFASEEYQELRVKVKSYPAPVSVYENKLKRLGLERKNWLADKKNRYIRRIEKYFNLTEKRTIIFANSIPQSEFISEEHSIHSKQKIPKGEISNLEKFNNGEHNKLVSVGMLDRGVSIINVDASIILQIPATQASATQKASRNLLDNSPLLIIPFFRETKDEENVQKFVRQFKKEYVEERQVNV
jgi:hypothetical protein